MKLLRETQDFVSLGNGEMNVVVHLPPVAIPEPQFNCVKMFITVENSLLAREKAVLLGGAAFDGEWSNPVFKVCNIADPEGNHIQLREFLI
ncbi:hypothetical protein [Alteromonas aestuariivivens]|nr:hypothetical protein [Alteromonas aestuariivivens]